MADDDSDTEALAAGDFSPWLTAVDAAIRGEQAADVPCGDCTGCCTSSQFVHIAPDETDALAHIPRQLLFPAPGLPRGHLLMGYDERGHCPMLRDGRCSIYAHRPRTCRVYDCRIFPAAEVAVEEPAKAAIAARTRRWQFSFPSDDDRARHRAVAAAARFLAERGAILPAALAPRTSTQLAVLAVEIHRVFLDADPAPDAVVAEVMRVAGAGADVDI